MSRIFAALAAVALAAVPAAGLAQDPSPTPLDLALALEEAFIEVAETAASGVVTVRVEGAHVRGGDVPEDPDELREWLRREKPRLDPFQGMGSGFIVDSAGTIFTNAHVVDGAQTIEVVFSDGRTGKADVVGVDKGSDVAVIRLIDPPDDLTVLPVGDSAEVRVGQFAIAIGSPLKLEGSFTVGHVSALHRNDIGQLLPGIAAEGFEALDYQDFMQVDTPINPGNSGGPLLDIHGRVIGINTAIYAAGGGGIGFSIPINFARQIGEQLAATGRVRRGWLGIKMNPLDPDLAEIYGLGEGSRVIIIGVEADSPAEKGRFQEQDIVLEFGGAAIRTVNDLTNAIANSPIGEEVQAVVYRPDADDDGRVELTVVLTERPRAAKSKSEVAAASDGVEDDGRVFDRLGVAFEARAHRGSKGAVVSRVRGGSKAAEAGLEAGDVITQVEDTRVTSADAAVDALAGSKRPFVPLKYTRAGRSKVTSIESR
jgi:serine protease Do